MRLYGCMIASKQAGRCVSDVWLYAGRFGCMLRCISLDVCAHTPHTHTLYTPQLLHEALLRATSETVVFIQSAPQRCLVSSADSLL